MRSGVVVQSEEGYSPKDAILKLLEIVSPVAKFNESVDVTVNLNIDSRKSDEQVRGVVLMPRGIGKDIKVAVFAKDKYLKEAEDAGADIYGGEDLVESITDAIKKKDKKSLNMIKSVDWCITTPDFMPNLSTSLMAKFLGSKGLMPNPKFGTVTFDIEKTVQLIKSGQVRFKADKQGIIHSKIGNIKFSVEHLLENLYALIKIIKQLKPSSVKGVYFKDIFIKSTMSKSLKIINIDNI